MKFKNSVVAQNVTRDFSICSEHNSYTKLDCDETLIILPTHCAQLPVKISKSEVLSIARKKKNIVNMSREIIFYITTLQ